MKIIRLLFVLGMLFFSCLAITTRADILEHWTTSQISTNSINDILYGGNRFVATATYYDEGLIYSSADGLHWSLSALDNSSWGLQMFYADGQFTGISSFGIIVTSTNGDDWMFNHNLPSPYANRGIYSSTIGSYGIAHGNDTYVVVGDTNGVGYIITSSDGTNWSRVTSVAVQNRAHIGSVAYGSGVFIALGDNDGCAYRGVIQTLPPGGPGSFVWTSFSIPTNNQVFYNSGLFMVAYQGTNLISNDGYNWTLIPTGITNKLQNITYAGGLFMANSGPCMATSTDGTNWFQYSEYLYGHGFASDGIRVAGYYNDNALTPNAFIYTSDPLVDVGITNSAPLYITVSGLIGRNYQIQSTDNLLGQNIWRTNTTLQLTNTPCVWTNSTATNSQGFYRGVLLSP
ncbi:MAG TPA: hypothetical protein VGO57_05060 [Verrucomicrobiae bacterium]|jgi:hypothetical protein